MSKLVRAYNFKRYLRVKDVYYLIGNVQSTDVVHFPFAQLLKNNNRYFFRARMILNSPVTLWGNAVRLPTGTTLSNFTKEGGSYSAKRAFQVTTLIELKCHNMK